MSCHSHNSAISSCSSKPSCWLLRTFLTVVNLTASISLMLCKMGCFLLKAKNRTSIKKGKMTETLHVKEQSDLALHVKQKQCDPDTHCTSTCLLI